MSVITIRKISRKQTNTSNNNTQNQKLTKPSNLQIQFKPSLKISTSLQHCSSSSGATPLFPTSLNLLCRRHYRLCGYINQWHSCSTMEALDLIAHLANHPLPRSLISIPCNLSNKAYSWLNRQCQKAIYFLQQGQ